MYPKGRNSRKSRGYNNLAAIEPGKSDKGRVLALLGSPSTESDFGPKTWMYIARHTEQTAFLAPDIVEQRVIYIAFDENNIVASIGRLIRKTVSKSNM